MKIQKYELYFIWIKNLSSIFVEYIASFLQFSIFVSGRFFKWEKDLKKSSTTTREIIQILNLRIIYIFLFYAFLCFFFTSNLLATMLGQATLVGMSLFWAGRTIEQFVFWKYNPLNINLNLTFLFILGAVLFALPLIY